MHTEEEYRMVLQSTLSAAQRICEHVDQHTGRSEPREIMQFCVRHGYVGYPTGVESIAVCGWLDPQRLERAPRSPHAAQRALAVIACFHDDPTPGQLESPVISQGVRFSRLGYVDPRQKLLVLPNIDWLAPLERGLQFLHEARHARQRFGSTFEGLNPLDPADLHEGRTWAFQVCLILDACGGSAWQVAVEREAVWLSDLLRTRGRRPGERFFAMSNQYAPGLDALFGPAPREEIRQYRNLLVGMRANFLLADRSGCDPDETYRNVVDRYYELRQEQR